MFKEISYAFFARNRRFIFTQVLLLFWSASALAKSDDKKQRYSDFDEIVSLIQTKLYDPKTNGVNLKKISQEYRVKINDVGTKFEFSDLVNGMLEKLHVSHASYMNDEDAQFAMFPSVLQRDLTGHRIEHIGVMGRQEGKEFVVAGVMDGSPAQKGGILSGDRLLKAGGKQFTTAGSFQGKAGIPVEIELKRKGATKPIVVSAIPVKENQLRAFESASRASAKTLMIGDLKIGYFHLWTMANDVFKAVLDQTMTGKLHDTDGMILDLRDGYGGIPFGYMDVFVRPDISWESTGRDGVARVTHTGYDKPLVVLINGGTRSAKEFFAFQMRKSKRAKLVGTRTAGAFLAAGGFPIGSDGYLELPILNLKADGVKLEGKGVEPDISVEPESTYSENDAQLLAAEKELTSEILKQEESSKANRILKPE